MHSDGKKRHGFRYATATPLLTAGDLRRSVVRFRNNMKRKCYIIAGPNGAGKTTFAREFLPVEAECLNFVNADLIALGLSPFQPEKMAIEAGR